MAIRDAAAALRVPDDALRAALDAAATRDPTPGSLARLKASGADGFRALVAIVRGGGSATDLFAASWAPSMAGEEQALIGAESADFVPASVALSALGHCDTSRTREYLV